MKWKIITALVLGLLVFADGSHRNSVPDVQAGEGKIPGLKLGDNNHVGKPFQVDNLTVFPIYAAKQPNVGKFITLDEALKAGQAEVRELGAEAQAPPPPEPRGSSSIVNAVTDLLRSNDFEPQQRQNHRNIPQAPVQQVQGLGAAQVNTLVIHNVSNVTILVLAGTVVVGGKQDRQVGQDFVIGPKKTVPVDAFCVEHGRWDANREGKSTGGKFGSVPMLANQKVRGAGQYKKDQSEVWNQVAKVNADNMQVASTGTLLASLSDKDISKKRTAIARKLEGYLSDISKPSSMVGLAYAVDGQVRGARWFINHDVYKKFKPTLVNTMAVEAITAQSEAKANGRAMIKRKVPAKEVQKFVSDLKQAAVKERKKTKASNDNAYKETATGYNSDCFMDGEEIPVTSDFLMK